MTSLRSWARPAAAGRARAEQVAAVLLLAVAVAVGLWAPQLVSTSSAPRTGVFPPHAALWIGAAVLGLSSLAWLVRLARSGGQVEAPDPTDQEAAPLREALAVFGILLAAAVSVRWLGLLLAAAVAYIAVMVYLRDRRPVFLLVSTVAYMAVLHYGLEVLLRVPLARSPIFPLPF